MPAPIAAAAGKMLAKKAATSKTGRKVGRNGCLAAALIVILPVFMMLALISVFVNALLHTTGVDCGAPAGSTGVTSTDAAIAAGALQDSGITDPNKIIVLTAIAGAESDWNVDATKGAGQGLWMITKAEDPQDFPPQQSDAKYLLDEDNNAAAAIRVAGGKAITSLKAWAGDDAYAALKNVGFFKADGTFDWSTVASAADETGYFDQAREAVQEIGLGPSAAPGASATATPDTSGACCPGSTGATGGGGTSTAQQTAYAKMIIGIAKTMNMGPQGELIGLMVALDESTLSNLANSNVPSSLTYPHDGIGSDHGSVGIFQQQVNPDGSDFGWGTLDQLMNSTDGTQYQAYRFFKALDGVGNWESMEPWVAAQTVQQSGTASGMNYYAQMGAAQALLSADGDAPAVPLPKGATAPGAGSGGGASVGCTTGGVDGYINPIKPGWFSPARTDQGVDWLPLNANVPILAIGDATITYSSYDSGWPGQGCDSCGGFMDYKLLDGPKKGYCIYVAENLTQMAAVGTQVKAGDQIAVSHPQDPWTEWGWAQCTPSGQYGGPATPYNGAADGTPMPGGKAFARFFIELGAKPAMDPGPGPDTPY